MVLAIALAPGALVALVALVAAFAARPVALATVAALGVAASGSFAPPAVDPWGELNASLVAMRAAKRSAVSVATVARVRRAAAALRTARALGRAVDALERARAIADANPRSAMCAMGVVYALAAADRASAEFWAV